jgi:hypothetical protein
MRRHLEGYTLASRRRDRPRRRPWPAIRRLTSVDPLRLSRSAAIERPRTQRCVQEGTGASGGEVDAARSLGELARERAVVSPVVGCTNASSAAWRNGRSRPRVDAAAVPGVADQRVTDRPEVHPDLVGATGLERHVQSASSLGRPYRSTTSYSVRAGGRRPPRPSSADRGDRGRSARRSRRAVRSGGPTRARRRRRGRVSTNCSISVGRRRRYGRRRAAGAAGVEAVHDARAASPRPRRPSSGKRASSPFTSVPSGLPAPGCTTSPAGLSTTITSSSSWTTSKSIDGSGPAARRCGTAPGVDRTTCCPRRGEPCRTWPPGRRRSTPPGDDHGRRPRPG